MCNRACSLSNTHITDDCMDAAYEIDTLAARDPEREPSCKPATDEEYQGWFLEQTMTWDEFMDEQKAAVALDPYGPPVYLQAGLIR